MIRACAISPEMDEDDPSFQCQLAVECDAAAVDPQRIESAVSRALQLRGIERAEISVAIVSDRRIAELNERFLEHEGPTDCITFNLADDRSDRIEGEIVVSWETAQREATARNINVEHELLLYVVHAALHLCGMEDDTPANAAAMHDLEDRVLTDVGIGPVFAKSPA